jgi:hypothetical protein
LAGYAYGAYEYRRRGRRAEYDRAAGVEDEIFNRDHHGKEDVGGAEEGTVAYIGWWRRGG